MTSKHCRMLSAARSYWRWQVRCSYLSWGSNPWPGLFSVTMTQTLSLWEGKPLCGQGWYIWIMTSPWIWPHCGHCWGLDYFPDDGRAGAPSTWWSCSRYMSGPPRGAWEHSSSREMLRPPTWFPVISVVVEVAPLQESYILEASVPETEESA